MPNADIEPRPTSWQPAPGLQVVAVPGPGVKAYGITNRLGDNDSAAQRAEIERELLRSEGAAVICQRLFGPREIEPAARSDWARTWLLGNGGFAAAAASAQTYAVAGSAVTPVRLDGEVLGGLYEDEDAFYCLLCGLRPADLGASRGVQAREVFERIERALEARAVVERHRSSASEPPRLDPERPDVHRRP